jgi:predicted AAA+ superfamily ATPase
MNEILDFLNPWWFNRKFEIGINREIYLKKLISSLGHRRAVLLTGSRRVGKTTLIFQLINFLLKKVKQKNILYALMDHPQLSSFNILKMVEEFRKHHLLGRNEKIYLFFDEIQYLKDWEKELKALIDTENVKIFFSGSTSSTLLLKSSYLTGRLEKIEVFPLDFLEFLTFNKIKISNIEKYKLEKYCEKYLKIGGYPEYVLKPDASYFADLVNNILYKDIINFYQLKNPELLKDLLLLLADRVGSQTTYSKLANILSLKMDTVKEYVYYLKNSFLIDELPRFTTSRGSRIYGPKKFYTSDNGLLFHLIGRFSQSAAFEQTLYFFLKRNSKKIGFYYENQKEVDFVIDKNKPEFIEAKYQIEKGFNFKLPQYLNILEKERTKKLIFVTKNIEKKQKIQGKTIEFIPLWKLLIS